MTHPALIRFFLLLGILSAQQLIAQEGSSAWFDATVRKIETADTVGLEAELLGKLNSSGTNEEQLRRHLAYCYVVIYTERHPLNPQAIKKCLSLDSLVQNDTLHLATRFMEGYYYYSTFNYPIALEIMNEVSLRYNNQAQSLIQARCFMERAFILQSLGFAEEAGKCMLIALQYYKANGFARKEAAIYNNLALASNSNGDTAAAFRYMARSIAVRDSIGDIGGLGQSYNNTGTLYFDLGNYAKALEYYERGREFRLRGGAPEKAIIESRINIGRTLYLLGRTQKAIDTLEKCYNESTQYDHFELKRRVTGELRKIYFEQGNYERAYEMQEMYHALNDTLYNQSMKEDIVRRTVEYDFRNREREAEFRRIETERRNNYIMISLVIGLALAGFFVYNLYRSNQQKKRSHAIILHQRDALDKKQQEITESIRYARFIQQTLLPVNSSLENALHEYFVLYQPKDIVSGDFYWLWPENNSSSLVAAADCTGHGVPGAFMSLLAKENLDKAAAVAGNPGELLAMLNRAVKNALHQDSNRQPGITLQDGLDIALIRIKDHHITFSGANRPLWIFRKETGLLEEIKPTKAGIGGSTGEDQVYAEVQLQLHSGDVIYLFTDGFADQFGGDKKKKLTTKKFKEVLAGIYHLPATEQKKKLHDFLVQWKGNEEQVDDILVMGIRAE